MWLLVKVPVGNLQGLHLFLVGVLASAGRLYELHGRGK